MPPKKGKTGEDRAAEKAKQAKKEANAADKTFGLKNKNKSKAVQQHIKQVTAASKGQTMREMDRAQVEKKKAAEEKGKQAALLAGLFNMATDKKGRVFDPKAKAKAKEKNMEEERSGANMPLELQLELVEGIKNAIRLNNPKGTNMSTIGGSVYVRDLLDDPKHEKHMKGITTLHFIRRRDGDFWIAEEDKENQNPTVRCKEDVDAQNAEDDRQIFVILEEKRMEFFGRNDLRKCGITDLKAWWKKSSALEHCRDPETGMIDPSLVNKPKPKKKLTGEELFKMDPSLFSVAADGSATKTGEQEEEVTMFKAIVTKQRYQVEDGKVLNTDDSKPKEPEGTNANFGEGNEDDDSDAEDEDKEEFQAGMEWGTLDDDDDDMDGKGRKSTSSSSGPSGTKAESSAAAPKAAAAKAGPFSPPKRGKSVGSETKEEVKVTNTIFANAVDDLPDDLDGLDDD